jgi:antitoxin MazE
MQTVARKWGNSLGIRIPKLISEQIDIHDGSAVNIELLNDTLIIKAEKKYNLEGLLIRIDDGNIHKEISFGYPKGKEIW